MTKIKKGEYFRAYGKIDKVISIVRRGNLYEDSGIYCKKYLKMTMGTGMIDSILHSFNIVDLIEVGDLMYVDIDNGYEDGIIVPRIAETINELNEFKSYIKNGKWLLKRVITHEEIEEWSYEVED